MHACCSSSCPIAAAPDPCWTAQRHQRDDVTIGEHPRRIRTGDEIVLHQNNRRAPLAAAAVGRILTLRTTGEFRPIRSLTNRCSSSRVPFARGISRMISYSSRPSTWPADVTQSW